jgi:hypothetical protein
MPSRDLNEGCSNDLVECRFAARDVKSSPAL